MVLSVPPAAAGGGFAGAGVTPDTQHPAPDTRPLKPETRNCILMRCGAVAQFGRAPRSQCGGPGFESPLLHQNSSVFTYLQDRSAGLEFPDDQYVTNFFCRRLRSQ
jgi:hypothetical protein